MRVLGIDLGDKRIGLAISDPLGFTAQSLETLECKDLDTDFAKIRSICQERQVEECVVGLPLQMDGQVGTRAKAVMAWIEAFQKEVPCAVRTWDERLTSKEAQRLMIHQDLSRKKQKAKSDELAAILILQTYLDYRQNQREPDSLMDED